MYIYTLKDSNDKYCCSAYTRREAREYKRHAETSTFFQEEFGEVPPYKIVRYELSNAKVVR